MQRRRGKRSNSAASLYGQEGFFSGGTLSPIWNRKMKSSCARLEHGQEPGIVQPEMLEIGMELEPAYARRLQAFQLALPRFVTGVQSAESRHFG